MAPWLALAAAAAAQPAPAPHCHMYVVVHAVRIDAQGQVLGASVSRIVDPNAAGTPEEVADRPIQMALPPAYLAAARAYLAARSYRGERPLFYTYTFYDPARPARADLTPADCR